MPQDDEPGSGNILVNGPPGSAKSTLALQFAVACADPRNDYFSAYISLENSLDEITCKAKPFGWKEHLLKLRHIHRLNEQSTPDELAKALLSCLLRDEEACEMCKKEGSGSSPPCDKHDWKLDDVLPRLVQRETGKGARAGQASNGPGLKSKVLLTALSPRPLSRDDRDDIFWTRYAEVERLLIAAEELRRMIRKESNCGEPEDRKRAARRILPLVVLDSLNMFAMRELTRDEIFCLMSLFQRHKTIGLFTVESMNAPPFDSTLADIVIALSLAEDNGYTVRYVEVTKARYQHQVYGRHPFKTTALESDIRTPRIPVRHNTSKEGDRPRHGVVVFPSLHYVVLRTEQGEESETGSWNPPGDRWGINALNQVLPGGLKEGSVIAIEGPGGTFKTNLALTFLAAGLRWGESGMLIRLHDRQLLTPGNEQLGKKEQLEERRDHWPPLGKDVVTRDDDTPDDDKIAFDWERLTPLKDVTWQQNGAGSAPEINSEKEQERWQALTSAQKAQITVWCFRQDDAKFKEDPMGVCLFEVDFKGGHILPEELIQVVCDVILRRLDPRRCETRIRRAVLDDVSEIGATYPFLRKSATSSDIFLPAFAHVMRNYGIDLVVTGTTGTLAEADEAVGHICAVADTVVSCSFCDVFGKRHVIVQGEGLIASKDQPGATAGSSVPPVIRFSAAQGQANAEHPGEPRVFDLDAHYLEGLVGFGTDRVYRPGVSLYVFEENQLVHGAYNRELEFMLRSAFASDDRGDDRRPGGRSSVSLVAFGSRDSEAMHDSATVFPQGEPLDRTVVRTVDEFCLASDKHQNDRKQLEERFVAFSTEGLFERNVVGTPTRGKCGLMVRNVDKLFVADTNEKYAFIWPYYMNLLLLAYREDAMSPEDGNLLEAIATRYGGNRANVLRTTQWKSPRPDKRHTWQRLRDIAGRITLISQADSPPIARRFWFDQSASETLSCAMLDALMSASFRGGRFDCAGRKDKWLDILGPHRRKSRRSEEPAGLSSAEVAELVALYELFQVTEYHALSEAERDRYAAVLPGDAGIYLCWYSQLRELLTRQPDLSDCLRVCPLPGRGFTGDWFIGIAKGSVSPALGGKIISMLCRRDEDYKRYSRGVGLPVYATFGEKKSEFFSWPRSDDVLLERVLNMHEDANSRADIDDYEQIRSTCYILAKQLTPLFGPPFAKGNRETRVRRIVGRLFKQIDTIRSQ